jgi:hypothetical protein
LVAESGKVLITKIPRSIERGIFADRLLQREALAYFLFLAAFLAFLAFLAAFFFAFAIVFSFLICL